MTLKEVKAIAKKMGLRIGRMKKAELIRSIQKAEGNIPCFATDRVYECGEENCLWREDCLKENKKSKK
ncbi:MAG TPA: SAP domain-containing protein [Candidatus Desulfofervidus auxilii]|uniref:SAP domain-containing protein n=1 Tax=Desulfofervidus auxilii TaxID=1621989 RepID=A0A7C0U4B9_DESA2|nr:Rho termination factor N-terminal domain-containing protein [Candidatus Desulfofervidus auxilii]HDD45085.1 SAP domain-containing protein [Candidatus Desulfofervidus auxilii]